MKVYLSHCIRGAKGTDATAEDMQANCSCAKRYGEELRAVRFDVHIPAEHEDFVNRAYNMNLLTEEQILAVDCAIIDACDAVVVLDMGHISRGMQVEIDHANRTGKLVLYMQPERRYKFKVGDTVQNLAYADYRVRVTDVQEDRFSGTVINARGWKIGTVHNGTLYYRFWELCK